MAHKKEILVALLVAAGLYAESNARIYVQDLSESQLIGVIRAMSNPMIAASEGSGAITRGQGGGKFS